MSQDPIAKIDISNCGPSKVWSFHQGTWTLFVCPGFNGILILRNSVDHQSSRFGLQAWKVLLLASETFQTEPSQSFPQTGHWDGMLTDLISCSALGTSRNWVRCSTAVTSGRLGHVLQLLFPSVQFSPRSQAEQCVCVPFRPSSQPCDAVSILNKKTSHHSDHANGEISQGWHLKGSLCF